MGADRICLAFFTLTFTVHRDTQARHPFLFCNAPPVSVGDYCPHTVYEGDQIITSVYQFAVSCFKPDFYDLYFRPYPG